MPSPLKSPAETEAGAAPAAYVTGEAKFASPNPRRIEMPLDVAIARSAFPSPLKSPPAIENGVDPKKLENVGRAVNVPSPFPRRVTMNLARGPAIAAAR